MKILFIDYFSPKGHVQFNRIHLKALTQIGEVYTIFREGYFNIVNVDTAKILFEIPQLFYNKYEDNKGSILYRIFSRITGYDLFKRKTLDYIRKQIHDNWDAIVFSHFDPKALSLMKPLQNVFAICHQYDQLRSTCLRFARKNNRLKYTLDIGEKYTIVALSDEMKTGIENLGVKNVATVPHGFLKPTNRVATNILNRLEIPHDSKYIFAPSFSHNIAFMQSLYSNIDFNNFLQENNLFILIKDNNSQSKNSNVITISGWLSDDDYFTLFNKSLCLLLPYGSSTLYRESGVVMECFAQNKPFLKINIPSLSVYNKYLNYDSTFEDIKSLKIRITELLSYDDSYFRYLENIADPMSHWKLLIKSSISDKY